MDPRLLRYYNTELQHVREMGGEFAAEFPKIAGRLGMDGIECADPYVERLLESFAFLAARVQLKLDAEFPRFTSHLMEMVYPHYLAPLPSMCVAQFQPDLTEPALAEGQTLPRDTVLRSQRGKDQQTQCEYRTGNPVDLWPVELYAADYLPTPAAVAATGVQAVGRAKSGIRFRLRCTADLKFNQIQLDSLPIYVRGSDGLAMRLYELLLGNSVQLKIMPNQRPQTWQVSLDSRSIKRFGFHSDQALLPYPGRSFDGYRLLQEYFAFPERFMFVELTGLQQALKQCKGDELDIVITLGATDSDVEGKVDAGNFSLYCAAAVNLFPKRCDRINLDDKQSEFHLVPDRTRPMDFEIYQVTEAAGFASGNSDRQDFLPFYALNDHTRHRDHKAFYAVSREPRVASSRQKQKGPRSSYIGSEVFLSLVDGNEAPYSAELKQLGAKALCTNRDLPLQMPVGKGDTDFTLDASAPVLRVRCIAGPTAPRGAPMQDGSVWRLIHHLSLNYLSLCDGDNSEGAAALRDLLGLYAQRSDKAVARQVDGVLSVQSKTVTRRMPEPGPITFGRGLEIKIKLEDHAFEGTGIFLLGAVLEHFFAKYASINSLTETVVESAERGEVMRWPVRIGTRQIA